ncbi:hypothetical protein [Brachybacterium muris]|uniref:Uncharacterized protein n=1 Tax=Brachybacterium muris UCD-AY4 TaxID=1249481 RepID=A0A022KZQ9_9MICO|nr:hypothetical protein [Brachybacterium muris]EYT48758.1 hypothetical protein D641_0110790 [Brachybacterium muris UCD-AY4]MCT1430365.1 hypothetical protein [Brachybacterium muris]MCT1653621.1 hypothetical protein [Brachybacterium muris]
MSVSLTPDAGRVRAVRRLARGPVVILLLTAAFFAFAGIYIGWFGTRWGLLLLVPVVGLALACGLLWSRTLRGEKALEAGSSYLTLDTTGATGAGAPQIPWSGIDRIELVRAAETPLDALPKGSRATVMNAGGTRGSWAIALLDGNEHTGRFDFVPTEEYHRFLITGRDLARAGDAVLLDRQDQP